MTPRIRAWFVSPVAMEWVVWALVLLVLAAVMWPALFAAQTTYAHDNLYWGYPGYHFWAESLLQGRLPLWNPFTHGGEPFYPLILQSRLLDPNSLVVLAVGSQFTDDLVLLYNWDRFVRGLLISLGAYLLLRRWAQHLLTRLALGPVLVLSSFHLVMYLSNGCADQFLWASWVLLVVVRLLEERGAPWRLWWLLGMLLGLNWQSYFFVGVWTLLLTFLVGIALFNRDLLRGLWQTPGISLRVACTGLITVLMMLPNVALYLEKDRFVFPARMMDAQTVERGHHGGPIPYEPGRDSIKSDSIRMSYEHVVRTGSFSSPWDFIQLIVPFANGGIDRRWQRGVWGNTSEGFMYFGLLVYAGAVYGLVAGRHQFKRVWGLVAVVFGLLILGPAGLLHRPVFLVYPPLWFMRHTLVLVQYFSLAVVYFFILGCNRAFEPGGLLSSTKTVRQGGLVGLARSPLIQLALAAGLVVCGLVVNEYTLGVWMASITGIRHVWSGDRAVFVWIMQAVLIGAGAFLAVWGAYAASLQDRSLFWEKVVPAAGFAVVLAVAGVGATATRPPYDWLCGVLVLLSASLVWRVRLRLGPLPTFWEILGGHLLLVLIVGRAREEYILLLLIMGVLPAFLWWGLRTFAQMPGMRASVVLLVFVFADLSAYAHGLVPLWSWERPDEVLGFTARPEHPRFPEARVPFPPCQPLSMVSACRTPRDPFLFVQQIRYSEVLHRKATVFTPLYYEQYELRGEQSAEDGSAISSGLEKKRLNSFLMPEGYFRLVLSNLTPAVIREVFAVGEPLIQFKREAVVADAHPALSRLQDLAADGQAGYLRDAVILSDAKDGVSAKPSLVPVHGLQGTRSTPAPDVPASLRSHTGEGEGFSWTVEQYDYNTLSLLIRAREAGLLYVADGFDPAWRATLDGEDVPVYRANLAFKVILLPRSEHRVEFVYDPVRFKAAVAVFYAMTLAALMVWGIGLVRTRAWKATVR